MLDTSQSHHYEEIHAAPQNGQATPYVALSQAMLLMYMPWLFWWRVSAEVIRKT